MDKILIQFAIIQSSPMGVDSQTRQFEFKGTFEEAKAFLDRIMKERIEIQEKKDNGFPFA